MPFLASPDLWSSGPLFTSLNHKQLPSCTLAWALVERLQDLFLTLDPIPPKAGPILSFLPSTPYACPGTIPTPLYVIPRNSLSRLS